MKTSASLAPLARISSSLASTSTTIIRSVPSSASLHATLLARCSNTSPKLGPWTSNRPRAASDFGYRMNDNASFRTKARHGARGAGRRARRVDDVGTGLDGRRHGGGDDARGARGTAATRGRRGVLPRDRSRARRGRERVGAHEAGTRGCVGARSVELRLDYGCDKTVRCKIARGATYGINVVKIGDRSASSTATWSENWCASQIRTASGQLTSPLFSADERAVHVVQGLELMEKSKVLRRRIIKARRENGTAVRFFGDFACQDDL